MATTPAAFAGAGPPTDTKTLERKFTYILTLSPSSLKADAGLVYVTATIHLVTTFDTDENATITIGKAHDNAKPGRDFTVNADKLSVSSATKALVSLGSRSHVFDEARGLCASLRSA